MILLQLLMSVFVIFFFQAEDGIRDADVTGVQTCALPISTPWGGSPPRSLCQKICYSECTENCPLRPCEHPGGSESENRPATRGTAHSEVQGDERGNDRCNNPGNDRPNAPLHSLLPTVLRPSRRRSV